MTLLVIAPACAGLIQLAIHLAKLKYLTTSNLLQFLRSPVDDSAAGSAVAAGGVVYPV